jgi:hypothetical protein
MSIDSLIQSMDTKHDQTLLTCIAKNSLHFDMDLITIDVGFTRKEKWYEVGLTFLLIIGKD